MKTHVTLLAFCLLGAGLVNGQSTTNTNTNTTSGTTTNSTTGTNSSGTMNNSTTPSGTSTSDGSTMSNGTTNSTGTGTMNSNSSGTMSNGSTTTNSSATPAYGTTTTTTTSSNNSTTGTNMSGDVNRDGNGGRAWGKSGKFGIYAGVNFSRFVNEPIPDGAYRAGYQVGIYGRSGGTVFGQLGLEYRTSTSNLVRNGTGGTTQSVNEIRGQIDQQFVAIPAYVGLRVGSALGLRLQAGAELSALIRHPNNKFNLNRDDFRRTMLNGLLGAGINLGPLTLDAVYNHGFTHVFEGQDTRRNLLALNLGLRF